MAEPDDLRAFIREIMARFDKKAEAWEAAERRRHAEVMARLDEQRSKTEDVIAENRAQREALFRMLDKLDRRGGTAPA